MDYGCVQIKNCFEVAVHITPCLRKSNTSYFAEYFCAGLTDCKNFNRYRVRDNQRTQVYRTFAMFRAQNFFSCSNKTVPSSPSQGNSNVALLTTETPDFILSTLWPPNCLDLNPVGYCVWNVLQCTAPRLTMWSTWNSTSWLNGQLSIIASSRRPMLSGVSDCMLVFALPVKILSIDCSDIIHSSCNKYWLTPIFFIFCKIYPLILCIEQKLWQLR